MGSLTGSVTGLVMGSVMGSLMGSLTDSLTSSLMGLLAGSLMGSLMNGAISLINYRKTHGLGQYIVYKPFEGRRQKGQACGTFTLLNSLSF